MAQLTWTGMVLELVKERVELQAAQQRQAGTALDAAATQGQGMAEQGQCTSQVPPRELHAHHAQQRVRLNGMSEQERHLKKNKIKKAVNYLYQTVIKVIE